MSFEPLGYVRHILHEVEFILQASAGVDASAFFADGTLQRDFIRSLEVIGEATKRLPLEFRSAHPEVDWRAMVGMRDRLIHGYFGVDLELVWGVVRSRVPELEQVWRPLVVGDAGCGFVDAGGAPNDLSGVCVVGRAGLEPTTR
jgi:uncharacterized protein with HEPN domain